MRTPRLTSVLLGLCALVALPACGDKDTTTEEVRAAIGRTADLASEFVYIDERPQPDGDNEVTQVVGVVEDDLRYQALVRRDEQPGYEQVVHDDALAMRFLDPELVGGLVDRSVAGEVNMETELEGITSLQALASRRWVVDPTGAPPAVATALTQRDLGSDPVFDATTALAYVERAVNESRGVSRWSEDDITPTYSASEDPFPTPEDGSGVIRYDLERPSLPAVSAAAGDAGGLGGEQQVLATRHFRKMAIYVQDDRVIQVIERIEAVGKQQEDFISYTKKLLKEAQAPERFQQEFEELTERDDIPEEQLSTMLLYFASFGLEQFGQEPILVRSMSLELTGLGEEHSVVLPSGDDVVAGSLAAMISSGRAKADAAAAGGGSDGGDDESTSDGSEGGSSGGEQPVAGGGSEGAPAGAQPVGTDEPPG